jgi:hypothetical protein
MVNDQVMGLTQTGAFTPEAMAEALAALPDGLTELYTHPATQDVWPGSAAGYRYRDELEALIAPTTHQALAANGANIGPFACFQDKFLPTKTNGRLARALRSAKGKLSTNALQSGKPPDDLYRSDRRAGPDADAHQRPAAGAGKHRAPAVTAGPDAGITSNAGTGRPTIEATPPAAAGTPADAAPAPADPATNPLSPRSRPKPPIPRRWAPATSAARSMPRAIR